MPRIRGVCPTPKRRPRGGVFVVQSVIFKQSAWTPEDAQRWLADHGFAPTRPEITKTEIRFRQANPGCFRWIRSRWFGKVPHTIRVVGGALKGASKAHNKSTPLRTAKLEAELARAKADYRFWASQEYRLSAEERRDKERAERQVAELERFLAKVNAHNRSELARPDARIAQTRLVLQRLGAKHEVAKAIADRYQDSIVRFMPYSSDPAGQRAFALQLVQWAQNEGMVN